MLPDSAAPSLDADVLVLGGIVVTMDAHCTVYTEGALAVGQGRILAVGPRTELAAQYRGRRVIDARGGLLLPGLIDGHTHLPMTLFRGLADDLPLHTWLEEHVWPAEQQFLNPETIRWGTRLGAAELIRSGVTTCCDMYFYADDVAAAIAEAGLRAILGQALIEAACARSDIERNIALAQGFIEQWRGHGRITPAIAPHAPYTVSPELFRRLHTLAESLGVPLLTHLAETKGEVHDIVARYGRTPVRHLAGLGVLTDRLIAAHCVWVDAEEIGLLATAGTGVVHCPRSNLKLASGVAPVPDLLRAGTRLGLGTDGAASNNELDLFAEIQMAALIHKGVRLDPLAVPARAALEMATIGGARALRLDHLIGSLEAGKRADVIVLDLEEDNLVPLYDPVSHLAYATAAADVRTVLIDCQVVLEDGKLLTLDEGEVRRQVRALAVAIGSRRRSESGTLFSAGNP
jgi:5-methylthioadenosine/S-adenosylhomocysteine deaminase